MIFKIEALLTVDMYCWGRNSQGKKQSTSTARGQRVRFPRGHHHLGQGQTGSDLHHDSSESTSVELILALCGLNISKSVLSSSSERPRSSRSITLFTDFSDL